MRAPFASHPLIRQFNQLKKYFRNYETSVSRDRVREFHQLAISLKNQGLEVAFDFLGSVNFGQATRISDVDLVIYLHCREDESSHCDLRTCDHIRRVEQIMLRELLEKYTFKPYDIDIVDCINLAQLKSEIERADRDSPVLLRFAFYRSVCRLVNAPLIRPYQSLLEKNNQLVADMFPDIKIILENLVQSSKHNWSFKKYESRMLEVGIHIPAPILQKIQEHLEQREIEPP